MKGEDIYTTFYVSSGGCVMAVGIYGTLKECRRAIANKGDESNYQTNPKRAKVLGNINDIKPGKSGWFILPVDPRSKF